MARFEISGFDALVSGLWDMAESTPQLRDDILKAEADVIERSLRQSISNERLIDTDTLRSSISQKKSKLGIRIGPMGEHHRYAPSGRRANANGIVSAGYVGYIHNYGIHRRGIPATKWLEKGVEKGKGEAYDAADKIYDEYMKKHNL